MRDRKDNSSADDKNNAPDSMSRSEFFRVAVGKVLPAVAILGFGLSFDKISWAADSKGSDTKHLPASGSDTRQVPTTGCDRFCQGGCDGGCQDTCSVSCEDGCTGCGNTCMGSCTGCGGDCQGGCRGGCAGCQGSCEGGCSGSCTGGNQ